MKVILLSNGMLTKVDDDLHVELSMIKWSYKEGYARRKARGRDCLMHRDVLTMRGFNVEGKTVHHINNDKLDNQTTNLQLLDSTSVHALITERKNRFGKRGVNFIKDGRNKPFFATIMKDGVACFLGYYGTAEEAAKAYDAKAKEIYGKDAVLNYYEITN